MWGKLKQNRVLQEGAGPKRRELGKEVFLIIQDRVGMEQDKIIQDGGEEPILRSHPSHCHPYHDEYKYNSLIYSCFRLLVTI